ncbi:MAG TPA: DUF4241 domain-containing protein [Chthoniobacter sp.]|jgi:hypothetical protein
MSLPFPDSYLANALRDELQFEKMTIRHRPIGDLILTSGKLVACDPLVNPETEPFNVELPRGKFPVVLSIATRGTDQRVAYATVRFRPDLPVKWEMLTSGEQDLGALKPGHIYGYPVDAGVGCFVDREAAQVVEKHLRGDDLAYETILAEMEKNSVNTWDWCDMPFGPGNLVAFSSGWGDGLYASYAGRNAAGEIALIVRDFGVAPEVDAAGNEKGKPPELPAAAAASIQNPPTELPRRSLWKRLFGG